MDSGSSIEPEEMDDWLLMRDQPSTLTCHCPKRLPFPRAERAHNTCKVLDSYDEFILSNHLLCKRSINCAP